MKKVEENSIELKRISPTLRKMSVGDTEMFDITRYSSIVSTIQHLKRRFGLRYRVSSQFEEGTCTVKRTE
jgi:hypothetical protein